MTEPKFNISKIKVKDNTRYTSEQIIESSQIKIGTNIFKVLNSRVIKNLDEYSYIYSVKLIKKFPSTLIIQTVERQITYLAYDKALDKYIRLDKEGVMLEIIDKAIIEEGQMLTFGILFPKEIKLKEKIPASEILKLKLYENVSEKYIKAEIDKNITSIKFEEKNIKIVLDYNLSVILEEKDLEYDISNLQAILNELEGKSGVVDMTKPSPIYTGNIN